MPARPTRIAVVGRAPIEDQRRLGWSFVSSSRDRIGRPKADWRDGRFAAVPEETELIPLPDR